MNGSWDRWHELLDKQARGPLVGADAEEFARLKAVVDKLDAEAADLARRSMDRALEGLKP